MEDGWTRASMIYLYRGRRNNDDDTTRTRRYLKCHIKLLKYQKSQQDKKIKIDSQAQVRRFVPRHASALAEYFIVYFRKMLKIESIRLRAMDTHTCTSHVFLYIIYIYIISQKVSNKTIFKTNNRKTVFHVFIEELSTGGRSLSKVLKEFSTKYLSISDFLFEDQSGRKLQFNFRSARLTVES